MICVRLSSFSCGRSAWAFWLKEQRDGVCRGWVRREGRRASLDQHGAAGLTKVGTSSPAPQQARRAAEGARSFA